MYAELSSTFRRSIKTQLPLRHVLCIDGCISKENIIHIIHTICMDTFYQVYWYINCSFILYIYLQGWINVSGKFPQDPDLCVTPLYIILCIMKILRVCYTKN